MAGRRKDRRSEKDRRVKATPVAVERRSGEDRRLGGDRRTESYSAADQVYAAIDLLQRSDESGALFDEDRALIRMAVQRLRAALRQLDEVAPGDGE
jgi:hypothetical protein